MRVPGDGGDRFGYQSASGDLHVFFGPIDLPGSTVLDPTMADVAILGNAPDETGHGGHVFTGAADSYFGLEVLGADFDGDGGGDLVFGAPHPPIHLAPAGDGEAFVFAGK